MKLLCYLARYALNTAHCFHIEFLWWELYSSVTRVNTSKFNMF